jgi:ribulose-5-phosphate 4-epimerase/fuculose-1-phosphate aldolase
MPELCHTQGFLRKSSKILMLRGHGVFSMGQTLEEAFHWVSCLEEACDIILETHLLGEERKEFRKHSESYSKW